MEKNLGDRLAGSVRATDVVRHGVNGITAFAVH
jgi:hypothetical protein